MSIKLANKLGFGFAAVQAGQKSATVNAEPRLIANSTLGKFSLTAPVTKAMQIAVGENVMFLNNIADVEAQVAARNEIVVDWANESGIDLDTAEGQEAAVEAFTVWAIAKGVPMFDSKGNAVMTNERYSKADKEKFIKENAPAMLDALREILIARVGDENASDDDLLAAITVDDVEVPTYQVCSGSKTAASGATATGIGNNLGFTDTSIWNTLKGSLGEDKTKKNRIFAVDLKSGFATEFFDGFKKIAITAYPIEYLSDEDVIVRSKKDDE